MKRISLLAAALVAALVMCSSAIAAEPIKIGAIFSSTGPASFLGEPELKTVEMLVEKINAEGGVLGRPLELIAYDDETDVNKCVLFADKLIKKDKVVAVIGPSTSGNTLAIVGKFPAAQIPLISCAAAERIVNPVDPWIFKTPASDRHAATRILQHAKEQGFANIAIITVSNGFGQSGRAVLQELIPAMGFNLVADEVYGPSDTDMTAQLTSIKNQDPDAIICWGTNPGPAAVAQNRVQLGIEAALYMSHGVASKKFIELAGEAAEGIMLPAGGLLVVDKLSDDHPLKGLLAEYKAEYEAAFNSPVSTFGGYGWDSLMLLVEAMNRAGSAEPQAIRDALEGIQGFQSISGIFNFSAEDHNGLDETAFEMVVIENGDWALLK